MTYVHSIGDLRTGRIVEQFPLAGERWARPLGEAGTASATLDLEDPDNAGLDPRFTAAPARSFWMIEWDSLPVWGGVIWTHRYTRKPKRSLSLTAAGLLSLWDHRKIVPALGVGAVPGAAADTNLTALSLHTIAKRLLQQAIAHTGGEVPLVLPADITGTAERHYTGYELPWLGEALRNLSQVADGPDIDIVPRRVVGDESRIEWVVRIGNPFLTQGGDPWYWDDAAAQSAVTSLSVAIDGTKLAARAWVPGSGSERDQLVAMDQDMELVDAGYPLLEVEDTSHTTTEVQATLDEHATDLVARRARPLEQWALTVRADADPVLGTYAPGDAAVIAVEGDPYIPDGEHLVRIISMSGGGDDVDLDVSPDLALV